NRASNNVEDRRGGGGFGGGPGVRLGGGIGIGTIAIALVGGWLLGVNPLTLLGMLAGEPTSPAHMQEGPARRPPTDDSMGQFVSVVLADTEDVWNGIFARQGGQYQEPTLVLFRGATRTECGV